MDKEIKLEDKTNEFLDKSRKSTLEVNEVAKKTYEMQQEAIKKLESMYSGQIDWEERLFQTTTSVVNARIIALSNFGFKEFDSCQIESCILIAKEIIKQLKENNEINKA
jgi:hypothetical protein